MFPKYTNSLDFQNSEQGTPAPQIFRTLNKKHQLLRVAVPVAAPAVKVMISPGVLTLTAEVRREAS